MADQGAAHLWAMRLVFVGIAFLIVFFHLIPLDTQPRRWAPPDLLLAFAFAWALRRPDFVPPLSLALVLLLADLMFQRPPGLMALLVVVGVEYLKNRTAGLSEASFAGEWIAVALVLAAVMLANRLILGLLLVPLPVLAPGLIQLVLTVAAYPLVVLVTQLVLGVRRPAPGDGGTLGMRG